MANCGVKQIIVIYLRAMKKIILLLFAISLVGCASKKDVLYFQDIDQMEFRNIDSVTRITHIQPGDILYVRITAPNPKSVIPFKFEKPLSFSRSNINNTDMVKLNGYLVDNQGNINLPKLGEIPVAGKSAEETERFIKKKLSTFVTGTTVSVRIVNFTVTVIGDVQRPGTFNLSDAHITLPQALGLAGDLNIHGERHNVLIIRTKGDKRIYKHIDLTQSDWMDSPYYYLKQNDIVYVQPNNPKVKTAGFIGSIGNVLSVASILLSAAVIIFR